MVLGAWKLGGNVMAEGKLVSPGHLPSQGPLPGWGLGGRRWVRVSHLAAATASGLSPQTPRGGGGPADGAASPQTSGWYRSSSHSPRRSCLSTAGMAAPGSSTSACPPTPCWCAGCSRRPGAAVLRARTWRSPCRCPACLPPPPAQTRPRAAPDAWLALRLRYFRYGAPPVINPLDTSFPANTSVQPSFFIKMLQSNASVNLSHPAPGDWFVAAHLPPSSQKIEVKVRELSSSDGGGQDPSVHERPVTVVDLLRADSALFQCSSAPHAWALGSGPDPPRLHFLCLPYQGFVPPCAYAFQPDMLVLRAVEVFNLEPGVPLPQTLLSQPSYLK